MYLGVVESGQWMSLPLECGSWPTDASGNRVVPFVTILDSDGRHVTRDEQAAPLRDVGQHLYRRAIGPEFSAGSYVAIAEWQVASSTRNRVFVSSFTVLPGGDSRGAYVGLAYYRAPNADYVVGQTDTGMIEKRRRPH